MARKHTIVSGVRAAAAVEVDNAATAQSWMQEISALGLIPHAPDGSPLPPDDDNLFAGPEDNTDVTPLAFLQSGLAAQVQLTLMNLPASTLLTLLIPQAPAALRRALTALSDDTLLDCYRRVRK